MKVLVCFLIAAALAIFSTLPLASAQVSRGARRGFTVTDLDNPGVTGHTVYRIDLDNPGNTVAMGVSGVKQELEGLYSIDGDGDGDMADGDTVSKLYGIAENPDLTSSNDPSIQVDLTAPAVSNGVGTPECLTGIDFGTETGAAWDPTTGIRYVIASDDRDSTANPPPPPGSPYTRLYIINTCGQAIDIVNSTEDQGLYLDGLAVGGDGTLYATDARLSDGLWKFNFVSNEWEFIGSFATGEDFGEDTGLANYRGVNGNETHLYMVTEGEGASRLGRLWTVDHVTGQAAVVGNITIGGAEVPEDLEGFDIPYLPLVGEQ
jgi:hypothetical protein